MAQADWASLVGSIAEAASFRAGVTGGVTGPPVTAPDTNLFVFGWHALEPPTAAPGGQLAHGKYCTVTDFGPTDRGIRIEGAIKRGLSASPEGFSPFLFAGLQGDSTADQCYMLGLSDEDPCKIVLRKGYLYSGVPAVATGNNLRHSVGTVLNDVWTHLRLDLITNENGDVVLACYRNDLTANNVDAPSWVLVPFNDTLGESYVDDVLGHNSGAIPLIGGRAGFGCEFSAAGSRAFVDHCRVLRQTA